MRAGLVREREMREVEAGEFHPHILRRQLRESNCCRLCGYGAYKEVLGIGAGGSVEGEGGRLEGEGGSGDFISLYESVVDVQGCEEMRPLTLDALINKYMPMRVSKEELYYPQVICSSCNYALDVTVEFFKKVAAGQKILSKIINESNPDKDPVSEEPSPVESPAMFFSKENPVLLAPKRRGRPRRDPNVIKTLKPAPALPSEYSESKPKRQSRRPLRYNPTDSNSSCGQVKEEAVDHSAASTKESAFPFLSQQLGSQGNNKLANADDSILAVGGNSTPQLKTNALLLGNISAEFTSLTHGENIIDLSRLSVIMDGDEETDPSALEPIGCTSSAIKYSKLNGSTTLDDSCNPLQETAKASSKIVSHYLMSERNNSMVSMNASPVSDKVDNDSDSSVRTIDFVVKKKTKRGRKKSRRKNIKKSLQCNFCKKEFSHPSSLAYHRNSVHSSDKKFVCKVCKKAFSHKQLLTNHAYVHSDEKGFKCELCPAKFKSKASLYTHNKSIHTENSRYTCDQCGQQFNLKSSLKAHLRRHTGEKPYACEFCHKQFSQKSNYSEHRRIHTGERPYKCDTTNCDKAFTTASQLRNHKITHSGTKQYLCSICGRGFTHSENFKYHMRRHNGEKPIECPICMKPFTEPCSLKKHWRLHTGEKPFACEICNKLFSDPSNYAKHKKGHVDEVLSKPVNVSLLDLEHKTPGSQVDVVSGVESTDQEPDHSSVITGPDQVVQGVGDYNEEDEYVHILNPENLSTLESSSREGQQVIYLYPDDLSYYTITLADSQDPMEGRPQEEPLQTLGSSITFAAMDAEIASQYFSLETVSHSPVTEAPHVVDTQVAQVAEVVPPSALSTSTVDTPAEAENPETDVKTSVLEEQMLPN